MARLSIPSDAHHLHRVQVNVRWGDMDALGHVNNTRFFQYFEHVRVTWLRAVMGSDWKATGAGPVLAHTSCDFKRPVVYPADLVIDLYSTPPGRSSVETYYEARLPNDDAPLCAVGRATVVWVDFATGGPTPLPDGFREAIDALGLQAEDTHT